MKSIASERIIGVASPLLLLLAWELCARFNIIDTRFFPAPTAIVGHMFEMWSSGELWGHLSASLQRLAVGLLLAAFVLLSLWLLAWALASAINAFRTSPAPGGI